MMFLPGLAVIFAGLLGGNSDVDAQVKQVMRDLAVKVTPLPSAAVQKLTHHSDATRPLVRSLHADGVIACELVNKDGDTTLRVVIYEGDGKLKTFTEVPITGKRLGRADLEVLRSNLADDVASMRGDEPAPAPEPEIEIDRVAAPKAKPVLDAKPAPVAVTKPAPAPATKPAPAPATKPAPAPATKPAPAPAPRLAVSTPTPSTIEAESEPAVAATDTASAADVAAEDDAVSADEIAAMMTTTAEAPATTTLHSLHLGVAAGLGVASRAFSPGPSTVLGYSSSPVPVLVLDAQVRPTKRLTLAIGVERTLQLSTPMRDGRSAPTTFSRWESTGTLALVHRDTYEIGARFGAGRRAFAIESGDTGRVPDSDYSYLVAGVGATVRAGQRVAFRATAALEPVLFGNEPTEMAFGEATRWALDVGASVELRASKHVFMRAAAQYQRFTWSWDMAGDRGAGGAIDEYPSGAISLGADY